jgi:cytochrome c
MPCDLSLKTGLTVHGEAMNVGLCDLEFQSNLTYRVCQRGLPKQRGSRRSTELANREVASAMKHLWMFVICAAAFVATVAAGFAQHTPAPTMPNFSVLEAEQQAGQQIFKDHCASCHTQKPGVRAAFGPSLRGVLGRPAGSVPSFPYSDALKMSGLIWTEDNLRKWISDNIHMVPNTLMPHVSISDPAEQIYLIAYLKKLKGPERRQ